jgi:hypothetical protein
MYARFRFTEIKIIHMSPFIWEFYYAECPIKAKMVALYYRWQTGIFGSLTMQLGGWPQVVLMLPSSDGRAALTDGNLSVVGNWNCDHHSQWGSLMVDHSVCSFSLNRRLQNFSTFQRACSYTWFTECFFFPWISEYIFFYLIYSVHIIHLIYRVIVHTPD